MEVSFPEKPMVFAYGSGFFGLEKGNSWVKQFRGQHSIEKTADHKLFSLKDLRGFHCYSPLAAVTRK
jgi:hypothetical protein